MPAAAERAGQHGRVDAAVASPDADARGAVAVDFLEQDRRLGSLRLGQQVDQTLGLGRAGARRRSGRPAPASTRRAGRRGPTPSGPGRARRAPAGVFGLERYRRRAISLSGAPASRSAAATTSVRGVALGCWKLPVSMTTPAARAAASMPSPAVSGTPIRQASSVTISHVAELCGVHPVHRSEARVGDVVVDVEDRHPLEQLAVRLQDRARSARARRSRRRRAGRSRSTGSGSRRKRSMPGRNVVHRPASGPRTRASPLPHPLRRAGDRQRGAERVRLGVLVADRQDAPRGAQPLDDLVRNGGGVGREIDRRRIGRSSRAPDVGHSRSVSALSRRSVRRPVAADARLCGLGPRERRSGSPGVSSASPSCGNRATGVGSDSPTALRCLRDRGRPRAR